MTSKQKLSFYFLVVVGLLLTAGFGVWWFNPENIPDNFEGIWRMFDVLIYILLSYVVWHQIVTEVLLWMIVEKIKQPKTVAPTPGMKVAFITTFVPGVESYDLLHKILPAMAAADYPHDSWILDEGNDDEVKKICKQYGVNYFTRKPHPHYNTEEGRFAAKTKGGNHNAWYDSYGHQYDIVAQIDTDFVPRKDFLTRTLGYFRDPKIAFVGTPQIYGNESVSLVAKGASQQSYSFYGPILRGLHSQDMTMLIGANHVIRVAALKEINYYEAHLTEDLLTGMTLHAKKWKSVYVPEALAVGEGPSTWVAYFNQQMRWAFGCIHIYLHHSRKLLNKMTNRHSVYYYLMLQHYFSGLAMMIGVLLLCIYFIFGIYSASMSYWGILYLYVPLLLWQLLIFLWTQRFYIRPSHEAGLLMSGRIVSIAAWPIYFLALVGVLRGKRLKFKVTPKGDGHVDDVDLKLFMPHLTIAAILSICFGVSFITDNQSPVMIFWAIISIVLLVAISLGAWLSPKLKRS